MSFRGFFGLLGLRVQGFKFFFCLRWGGSSLSLSALGLWRLVGCEVSPVPVAVQRIRDLGLSVEGPWPPGPRNRSHSSADYEFGVGLRKLPDLT